MTPVETLRSELHPDGKVHACYPTADLTLCGRRVAGGSSSELPDCGSCSKTARLFDRVDGSMPDRWRADRVRPPVVREVRVTEDDVCLALRAAAVRLGRSPYASEWDRCRWAPSYSTIFRRFGTWSAALEAAGLA